MSNYRSSPLRAAAPNPATRAANRGEAKSEQAANKMPGMMKAMHLAGSPAGASEADRGAHR